ncbi:MAG: acyl-CoA dehydrogenase family protein [Gammaproteobacteria bacterium]|nr:acyl-CoA dehydrogenase family protein [Gammaproteobacteria bacterium]
MINFNLTDEQQQLRDTVRRFAENEIKPVAARIDRIVDPRDSFPAEIIKKATELGFHSLLAPEEWGGMGGGLMEFSILLEELAYGDVGIGMSYMASNSTVRLIAENGTDEQKERWLAPYCDTSGDTHHLFGFGGTEPSGGTEIFCPEPNPKLGVRTTAKQDGDNFVINGRKCFITNAGNAELYGCLARTDKSKPNFESSSIFFVRPDASGFSIGKIEDKMGHRLMCNGELVFDGVVLSKDDMLGANGTGLPMMTQVYNVNGVGTGALAVGLARAAYDMAVDYAKEREIWGRPITQYQSVSNMLVDMKMQIEASRLLVWRVAWAGDNGIHDPDVHHAMAKIYATDMVKKVTTDALQILGGSGYMKDYPAEKYVRDCMVMPIYDGTNEVLRHFMALDMYS